MAQSFSTGIFIPIEKQSLFILAFEDVLVNSFNVIPLFGPNTKKNESEIVFTQTSVQVPQPPRSWEWELKKAKMFLKEHLNILETKRKSQKAATSTTTSNTVSSNNETKMIDLTEPEHEIIVLDETLSDLEMTMSHLRTTVNAVCDLDTGDEDDVPLDQRSTHQVLEGENDIQILFDNNKEKSPDKKKSLRGKRKLKKSLFCPKEKLDNDIKILGLKSKSNNKGINKTGDGLSDISVVLLENGSRSVKHTKRTYSPSSENSQISLLNISEKLPNKKRKLDVSNRLIAKTDNISPSASLSDGVLNYYTHIGKRLGTFNNIMNDGNKGFNLNINAQSNQFRKMKVKRNIKSPTKKQKMKAKSKVLQENSIQSAIPVPQKRNSNKRVSQRIQNYNIAHNVPSQIRSNALKSTQPHMNAFNVNLAMNDFKPNQFSTNIPNYNNSTHNRRNLDEETNIFNPNPYNVDQEGLRPIAIDGCNVAIKFGKGKFASDGLVTCVDYFVRRGHERIKVFMPQFREAEIPKKVLEELKKKCDMVFTPSMCVNGVVRASYDDRFIVQYAFEFDAVIVSNDNYRDLLKENPKWAATIQNRLLMFNFIDDSVMFPLDPLGRKGPTLKEFLRF